jgi:superfamily II DNA or RNA helicase
MTAPATSASVSLVRQVVATTILSGRSPVCSRLGRVELRPHQHAAAVRLAALVDAHGGAMLADPVGVGKTFTALAVAARFGVRILIVAPAALKTMWLESLARCDLCADFISHESLSRGVRPALATDVVVVDESHRLRSPSTRRYSLLADVCRASKVLLLSATPVQNRRADLCAQLALFLGRSAGEMNDDELAAHVVRQAPHAATGMPGLSGPHLITLETQDDCLEQLVSLAPPVPAQDESIAVALLCYGLIHQWTSSRAALVLALQRRRARGLALSAAIAAGRRPTRPELSAWTYAGDTLQLAFPEIVTEDAAHADIDAEALRISVDRHVAEVEALLQRLRQSIDPDAERADAIRRIRAAHPGERVIAFCHYAETVNALRSRLAMDAGVAALTAHGARIAGGRVTRDYVLQQFTARLERSRPERAVERIDLLLTTDLLSEGLNLQEASVIVHLDLPWNPARLDQRVGRALRLGSRHQTVTVYAIAPPAAAERVIQIERRLREKLNTAQRTVGVANRILPSSLALPFAERGLAEQASAIDAALIRWLEVSSVNDQTMCCTPEEPSAAHDETRCCTLVASVEASVAGFLALVRVDGLSRLVVDAGAGIDTGIGSILIAVSLCDGRELAVDDDRSVAVRQQLERWIAARAGESTIDLRAAIAARLRRPALTRVAQALARAPRHRRAVLAPLADAARAVATAPLSEGAERILDMLVRAQLPDEAWLRSIATFGQINAPARDAPPSIRGASSVDALILFGPAKAV